MAVIRSPIEKATPGDVPGIQQLLREAKLPVDQVADHIDCFFVARDATGIVGTVGLELYGDTAILRSLAVAQAARGRNLGLHLARAVIEFARVKGVETVVLLTETAEGFFGEKLGFEIISRTDVPRAVRESWQFTDAVCQSATCMKLGVG